MELLVLILAAGMCFALLPLLMQLLAALIGMAVQALLRLLAYALERAGDGFRWGMSDGLDETWRTAKRIAASIRDAATYAYTAVGIFIEEWRGGQKPPPPEFDFNSDFDLSAWQREQEARERAKAAEADRTAREHFEAMQARARAEEEAQRRAEDQARARAEQQQQERHRRQQEEQARARRKSPPPSAYDQALALLGLKQGFTQDDLKRAFRTRIKAAHPDAGGSTEAAAALNAAYTLLKERRAA